METETPATQERYYAILAGLGGADALKMVNTAFEKGSASQKTAAVAALNDWKDASATNSCCRSHARTQLTATPLYRDMFV